jgi:hypothetical protein
VAEEVVVMDNHMDVLRVPNLEAQVAVLAKVQVLALQAQ